MKIIRSDDLILENLHKLYIMPEEFTLLDLRHSINKDNEILILSKKTSNLWFLIQKDDAFLEKKTVFQTIKTKNICISIEQKSLIDLHLQINQCLNKNSKGINFALQIDLDLLSSIDELGVIESLDCKTIKWINLFSKTRPKKQDLSKLRALFQRLRQKHSTTPNIFFLKNSPHYIEWQIESLNTFSGIKEIHIDTSNSCTQSCVFCGLYAPSTWSSHNQATRDFAKQKISKEIFLKILENVTPATEEIQFGGAGEPLTHPDIELFITEVRKKGISVSCLSSFEDIKESTITRLSKLATPSFEDFLFYVNLPAATPDVYTIMRPNNKNTSFLKVIKNLQVVQRLNNESPNKIGIILLFIITKHNYKECVKFIKLAICLQVSAVYFKPVEIQNALQQELSPNEADFKEIKKYLKKAFFLADKFSLCIYNRESVLASLKRNQAASNNSIHSSFISQECLDIYKKIPCRIGYLYLRAMVNGNISFCCVSPEIIGNINEQTLASVWHSEKMEEIRKKLLTINHNHFHLHDDKWYFCKICSHIPLNTDASMYRSKHEA